MTSTLTWAIILLVLGLIILVIEVFVPSGGMLGVLAGACLLTSLGLAFSQSLVIGSFFLAFMLVAVPAVVGAGMHYWPDTTMGRKMVLQPPKPEEVDPTPDRDRLLPGLVGQIGRTLTPHLPSGITEFEGRRVETTAENMSIDAGKLVRVVDVQGHRVIVRRIETETLNA